MSEAPPGSWPAAEEDHGVPVDLESSRPSTMETYTTTEDTKWPGSEGDKVPETQDQEEGRKGKQRISSMPELPPEIRETYVPPIVF